ncbi:MULTISPECIES: lysoplasmalogenase [Gordonia]|nr:MULTISPECIES: lysoplasmalogenase [Gordonia]MDH3007755.1 lysoplasmalogenase [Gordonia alkanivorans]MDH3010727.1 lysoplasmalogenase [Gordonia alkanivorans]MDH3015442.1 lysoplasmalogenase [Gordonia alkanivorans]MDH3020177.1 lysoplasmalogenase [Gordonia alkanivorans]MDH3023748.1 lysoplasmalogenase [Gordonia alkanivorans]
MGRRLPDRRLSKQRAFDLAYAATTAAATVTGALGHRRAAGLTKPLPMLLLVAQAAAGARERDALDNAGLAGALAFSMAGDRLMLLEEFETEPVAKDRYLRLGATLFAGAQLSYVATMWRAGARPSARQLLPRVGVLAESAAVLARHRPALLPVLGTYGNTLATMSATASAMSDPQPRLRIGGVTFLLSDLAIINRRHLVTDPRVRVAGEAWVLASYFAAQYLLIGGLAERLRRR